jgi:hypothetical protein
VSDFRFYLRQAYSCPFCLRPLAWKRRPDSRDSLMLQHELHVTCPHSGKKFYAPAQQLTEIPWDAPEFAGTTPKAKRSG